MDDLDLSAEEPSAKKSRKPAAKRARASRSPDAAPEAVATDTVSESSAPAKRVRSRRGKPAAEDAAPAPSASPELFSAPSEPPAVAAPSGGGSV